MVALPDVSAVARLMADPTRAALLACLLDGRSRAAGELAARVAVSAQAASNHLARLRLGGLLVREVRGRQRIYRLHSAEVARALEALAALRPAAGVRTASPRVPEDLRFARSCYDHLAGSLGVAVTDALQGAGLLLARGQSYRTTARGEAWLADLGVDATGLERGRRPFARGCLDWSERRPHLGGALGAALLSRWLEVGWLVRLPSSRAVRLTLKGRRALEAQLSLRISSA